MLPLLVLVSGPPGAGKSTLAAELGARLPISVVSVDVLKASLARYGGDSGLGGPVGQAAFEAAYDVVGTYLDRGVDLLLEKAWKRGVSEASLLPLVARSRAVQVHVSAPVDVLVARGVSRPARPGLVDMAAVVDAVASGTVSWSDFEPLDLDVPLLRADSSEPFDVDGLIVALRALSGHT